MAGKVVQIIPRTSFTLNATGGSNVLNLGPRAILTQDWASGVLLVRLHSNSIASGATVVVSVSNVSIVPEDPSTVYAVPSSPLAQVTLASGDSAPRLYADVIDAPIGVMVAVAATYTLSAGSGISTWEMSVDLLGRDT